MKVPLLDLKPQLSELREEIVRAVTEVIDSTRYIQGPEVESFEQEVARYCGTAAAIGVSSGTDALLAALMALEIGPGDRVLTTPYSFFATMGVILRCGAIPVFADIRRDSYNLDPQQAAEVLAADRERKIKAIMPVHLYGQCADLDQFVDLAEQYGVAVIEDAAQAIGAEYPSQKDREPAWRRAGSMGSAGCFSFFPSKNLGGVGDGGMVVTNDLALAEKIALLRNHGAHPKYYHALIGGNFRLDPIQAAVLKIKLNHLEHWHQGRRANAARYDRLFSESGLTDDGTVTIPEALYRRQAGADQDRNYHIYNQYVIRVRDRQQLRQWLQEKEIGTEIYYPLALHQQECVRSLPQEQPLPEAEKAAEQTLALPIYPELSGEMQEQVVEAIQTFYR